MDEISHNSVLVKNDKSNEEESHSLPTLPTLGKREPGKGEKTICCWNCLAILLVKSEWSVVQCTTCEKLNRIPGDEKLPDNLIKLNDNLNHFDLKVPYVYGVITCPFCQMENKFRRDADHIVCYKCHNSFSLEESVRNGTSPFNSVKPSHASLVNAPPNKALRYSDMFFPDPMYFRGYYPQPYFFNQCDCSGTEKMLRKLLKSLNKPVPKPKPVRRPDPYGPLRKLVRDIDDINERGVHFRGKGEFGDPYNHLGFNGQSLESFKNNLYGQVYRGGNSNGGNNRMAVSSNYSSMKNEAVYKTLFNSNPGPYANQFANNRYSYL